MYIFHNADPDINLHYYQAPLAAQLFHPSNGRDRFLRAFCSRGEETMCPHRYVVKI